MSGDTDSRLRAVRIAALAGGAGLLLLAMLIFPETPRRRDLLWSVGVALLILAIVTNHLVARRSRGGPREGDPPGGGAAGDEK